MHRGYTPNGGQSNASPHAAIDAATTRAANGLRRSAAALVEIARGLDAGGPADEFPPAPACRANLSPTSAQIYRAAMGRALQARAAKLHKHVERLAVECGAIEADHNTFDKGFERSAFWSARDNIRRAVESLAALGDRLINKGADDE